jgi:sugar lactone lactonase YvrE
MTRVDVGTKSPAWPRCGRDELWVTTTQSLLRVDPRTGVVRARIEIGGTPGEAIAAPDGLLWVTDRERSLVFRVDPQARRIVDSFAAGPGAFALARLGSSVWVTSFAGADVRRFDP